MIGSQFVDKDTLVLSFVVISHLVEDTFLVMNYQKIRTYQGHSVRVLVGTDIMSKDMIDRDYIKFDSPEYHLAIKIFEKSALG